MLSRRPYLIRALYEWLLDSGEVPHLLVDAAVEGAQLPEAYIQEGRIVLNIGPSAVQSLDLGNDEIVFSARFGGTPRTVRFSPAAVIAIYGRDSGQGMMFGPDDDGDESAGSGRNDAASPAASGADKPAKPGKPSLKIIK
ncbi:MAG TPA: ClpXP protease specificity-enhancing factor [Gammaproteobacteria bacterium]